ncbi:hypothetical protein CTAM01_16300 [Colletotrichum tamarilloi]|uniref:Uncharacterized protein n=1 Tax=Colletotrichum tamarilloi TaxID=1209934 RepID=A0ABQ9QIZ8_9PEZI|nr:uncharacterized protein CTAM01_16300 [Colletotrichum tamarilloi]KAK1472748.1 hypothetical protein CTAM01_16300 [Colletotrichum tamarilloi]
MMMGDDAQATHATVISLTTLFLTQSLSLPPLTRYLGIMATHFSLICGKSASQIHHPASRPSSTRRGSLSRELGVYRPISMRIMKIPTGTCLPHVRAVISQHGSLSTNRDKLSAMFRLRLNCFPDDVGAHWSTIGRADGTKDIFIALVASQTRKRREQEGLKPERRMDWSRPLLCTSHILSSFIHFTSPRLARLWPN